MIWRLLSKCQIKWEIVSNFCGLFRMSELYHSKKKSSNRNLIANLVYVPYLLSYVTIGVISNARAFFACVSFGVWHVRFSGHECEMWQNVRGSNGILGGLRSHTQWVEIVLIRYFFISTRPNFHALAFWPRAFHDGPRNYFALSSGSNFSSSLHNIRVFCHHIICKLFSLPSLRNMFFLN